MTIDGLHKVFQQKDMLEWKQVARKENNNVYLI